MKPTFFRPQTPWALFLFTWFAMNCLAESLPEPGPENCGLRMRLVITPDTTNGAHGFEVRVDIINSTKYQIELATDWDSEYQRGNFLDYVESTSAVITDPVLAPDNGQIVVAPRLSPQSTQSLGASQTLTLKWHSNGQRIKNKSMLFFPNPKFSVDGLYGVHFCLEFRTSSGLCRLRSNEQMVSVGGLQTQPKNTYGQFSFIQLNGTNSIAQINLGSINQIQTRDRFTISTGYIGDEWSLEITNVYSRVSYGTLIPIPSKIPALNKSRTVPRNGSSAVLLVNPTNNMGQITLGATSTN